MKTAVWRQKHVVFIYSGLMSAISVLS